MTCKDLAITYKGTFPAGWSLDAHPVSKINAVTGFETQEITDRLPATATWHLYTPIPGVGVQLTPATARPAGLTLTGVVAGAPAAQAGAQVNNVLVEVNGKSIAGLSVNQIRAKLRGGAGTLVTLGVLRGPETTIRCLAVTRAVFQSR